MAEYAASPEVVRVALAFGVILSILFYERVQLTTGGAIVPPYLAIAIVRPLAVVLTLIVGYLTYVIVHVVISKYQILYGRRKFETEVLVGLALIMVSTVAAHALGHVDPLFLGLTGVGFLVPGIIAHDMGRQRPTKTLLAIGATTAVLAVVVNLVTAFFSILPGKTSDPVQLASVIGYPREFLVVAVALSVLTGMWVFTKTGLRSGGFITGAYLALISPRWYDLLFVLAAAVITWFIVVKVMMPRLLLFGRRKVSIMILVGGIVAWAGEIALRLITDDSYTPWRGLTLATLMVPALIANDAQRQGWERTMLGAAMAGLGVFTSVSLIVAAAEVVNVV